MAIVADDWILNSVQCRYYQSRVKAEESTSRAWTTKAGKGGQGNRGRSGSKQRGRKEPSALELELSFHVRTTLLSRICMAQYNDSIDQLFDMRI